MKKEFEDALKAEANRIGPHIEQSKIFLSLLSKSYKEDPMTALQLGIAVLLGKPIAIVTIGGEPVPETLKKLAFCIEHIENDTPESIRRAADKVTAAIKEKK